MSAAWGKISAEEILSPIKGTCVSGSPQTVLAGVSTDSRHIASGEFFWALKGERYDGHDFVQKAAEKGAAGVVVQQDRWKEECLRPGSSVVITVADTLKALGDLADWWRRQHKVQVLAVTGSSGKTTTKEMAADILSIGANCLRNQGNFNNLIGLPLTLLQLHKGFRKCVMEMGMNRPGEIARLTEIASPDAGVITNVGMAHLEGLGDLEGVAKAKVELVEKMSPRGQVILNGDDALLLKTASIFKKKTITFGLGKGNDIRADSVQNLGRDGIKFNLLYQGSSYPVRLRVQGLQNVFNALAAAAATRCLGASFNQIVEGLDRFVGLKGRFMLISLPGDMTLIDDTYNANPSSLKAAFESIGALAEKGQRIIVGLGEMMELGDRTVPAHREAGRMVAELRAEYFVAMGDHANDMVEGAVGAGMPRNKTGMVTTHSDMVRRIADRMRPRDLIFLKGSHKVGLEKVVDDLRSDSGNAMNHEH